MSIFSTVSGFIGLNKWYFIAGAVAAALAAGVAIGWHEEALRIPGQLDDQKAVDSKACSDAQAITKGENDELQRDRDRIAADAARYKRLHPDACLYISHDGKLRTSRDKHAGLHGISTDWLRDYAALCETYRSEVMVCSGQRD